MARVITDELIHEMAATLPIKNPAQCEGLCEEIRSLFDQWDSAPPKRRQTIMVMIQAVRAQMTALHCSGCMLD